MKRGRAEGPCPHFNTALSAVDYGNIILQYGSRVSPSASFACCACGQLVSDRYGITSEADATVGKLLRGCACGSVMLVDIVRSELYCCNCNDYVYDSTFDEGRQLCHVARRYIDRGLRPGLPHHDPGPEVWAKRLRVSKGTAVPVPSHAATTTTAAPAAPRGGAAERKADQLLAEMDVLRGSRAAGTYSEVALDGFPAGLRGLNNLGNTCFMNSVLQVFIHSPLMRNYFLGQGHSQSVCSRIGKSPGGACLSCELDAVFAAAYSGERAPLSPTDFLYSWWTFADSLAGYRQQDAHEFYLSALSGLTDAMITEPGSTHGTANPGSGAKQRQAPFGGADMAVSPDAEEGGALASPLFAAAACPWSRQPADEGGSPQGLSVAGGSRGPCGDVQPATGAAAAAAAAAADWTSGGQPDVGHGLGLSLSLVDAVFGGVLRSDVTCSVCGHTSTAYDPFLDISLDMVTVVSGPPHLPTVHVSRQPLSESTPASSPTLIPKLAAPEEDETEAEGASREAAAAAAAAAATAARPSASTCGGRSSLSALSAPSLSPSPSVVTGMALVQEGHGYGVGDEAQQGRSQQGACASPSTGSGSAPNGDEDAGGRVGRCEEADADEGTRRRKGLSTASDNSCGPSPESRASLPRLDAGGTVEMPSEHFPNLKRSEADMALGSRPHASARTGDAVAAATAAAAAPAVAAPGHYSSKPTGGLATAAITAGGGLARTTSDSVAAAESAADGGGGDGDGDGDGGQAEFAASPGNPDDCITSPGLMIRGPQYAGKTGPPREELGGNPRAAAIAAEAVAAAGPWRCDDEGGCELASRGVTPGASASVVEGTTAGGLHSPEEDGEVLLTQGSVVPQDGLEPQTSWDGQRGAELAAAGAPGRATRGRGRGARGRRSGAGGRAVAGGSLGAVSGGKRSCGPAVPQMGQPGASTSQMVDPQLTRPQGANHAEAGPGAQGVAGHATLHGCLRHFVTPERLSAGEAWVCSACKRHQPAVKQLSIRRLPPVLALHVKRFEHRHHHHHHHHHLSHPSQHNTGHEAAQGAPRSNDPEALYGATASGGAGQIHGGGGGGPTAAASSRPGRHAARKIQTQLQFPISLDLAPYTTPAILRERYGMRHRQAVATAAPEEAAGKQALGGDEAGGAFIPAVEGGRGGGGGSDDEARVGPSPSPSPSPSCRYHLFAVISHKGDLSGGHYVVFVRPGGGAGGSWFQCDDSWVTAVSEEDVRACQAYMLFYSAEL